MAMKLCDRCEQPNNIRYRIQYDRTKRWILVCRNCWDRLSANNPSYSYGGTWKSKQPK